MKRTEDREGPARTGVWVILRKGEYKEPRDIIVGKIIIAFPRDGAGVVYVSFWDWTADKMPDVQSASAGGYGYDKLASALSGMKFGSLTFEDHPNYWRSMLGKAGYEVMQLL